jgi:prepilin-type N-terminal cleavage/methylation domain-containing protein
MEYMSNRSRSNIEGYSLVEILVVVALIGVVSAIAAPLMGAQMKYFRLSGDARSTSNAIALAKMRAASIYGRTRLYVDLTTRSFHVERFDTPTSTWVSDGVMNYLSQGVQLGFAPATIAPPSTQGTIGLAPNCKTNAGSNISNTACVIFNSRGLPIDSTGSMPPEVYALYVTDGTAIFGITVSQTGMVRMWRTPPTATPAWTLQ